MGKMEDGERTRKRHKIWHDGEAHVKPVFWKFRLRRSLKGVVCSSIFRPFGGGTPCQIPPEKGLGPAGYCKDRKLCLRCPQSSLSIPRNDDMARHNLWRKRQTSPSSLLLIGMDSSQRRDGPCQGLSMANKKLLEFASLKSSKWLTSQPPS